MSKSLVDPQEGEGLNWSEIPGGILKKTIISDETESDQNNKPTTGYENELFRMIRENSKILDQLRLFVNSKLLVFLDLECPLITLIPPLCFFRD